MEAMTLQEVVTAVRGTLLGTNIDPDTAVTSVVSDNRKATDGSLFAAFIGENTDGHRYVDAALTAGAVGALISADPGTYLPSLLPYIPLLLRCSSCTFSSRLLRTGFRTGLSPLRCLLSSKGHKVSQVHAV